MEMTGKVDGACLRVAESDAARLSLDEHRLTSRYRCTLPFSRAGWSYCLRRCRMWSNGLYQRNDSNDNDVNERVTWNERAGRLGEVLGVSICPILRPYGD